MTIALGVLYVVLFVWAVFGAVQRASNQDVCRWHAFVVGLASIGVMVYLEVPALTYWCVYVLVVLFGLPSNRAALKDWQSTATTVGLLSVGFWLPALAFAFQPAYPWSTLYLLVPVMLGTYVPFLRQRCRSLVEVFVLGRIRASREALNSAELRKQSRADWLARR